MRHTSPPPPPFSRNLYDTSLLVIIIMYLLPSWVLHYQNTLGQQCWPAERTRQWMAAWWSVPQTEITQNTIMRAMNGSLVISTTDWNHTEYDHEVNEWQLGDQYNRLKSYRIWSRGQWMAAWWSVQQTEIIQNMITRAMNGSLVISTTDWNHTEYDHEETAAWWSYHRLKSYRIQWTAAWRSVQQTETIQNAITKAMNSSLVISTTDWNHTEYNHDM